MIPPELDNPLWRWHRANRTGLIIGGIGLALGALLLVLLWTTHSHYLARWDSAQYALALEHLDVRLHQPHPPGYPLYVMAAKLVRPLMMGEANVAFLLVNFGFVLAATASVAAFARELGPRFSDRIDVVNWWPRALSGLIATLLFLASPLTRYFEGVALSYAPAMFFFLSIGWACWGQLAWDRRWWKPFVFAAVAGAFRLPTLVISLPLLAWMWWRLTPGRKVIAPALMVLIVGLAYWPVIAASGGWTEYRAAMAAESLKHEVRFANWSATPMLELRDNALAILDYCYRAWWLAPIALLGLLLPMPRALRESTEADAIAFQNSLGGLEHPRAEEPCEGLSCALFLPPQGPTRRTRALFLALWLLPGLVLYLVVHVNFAGIFLDYQGPLAILIALGLIQFGMRLPKSLHIAGPLLIAVPLIAMNLAIFYTRAEARDLTLPLIRSVDRYIQLHLDTLPNHAPSGETVLLTGESFKQLAYYLPSYRVIWDKYLLRATGDRSKAPPPILTMHGHQLEPWTLESEQADGYVIRYLPLPEGTRRLLFDPAAKEALPRDQAYLARPLTEESKGILLQLYVDGMTGIVAAPGLGWWVVADEEERAIATEAFRRAAARKRALAAPSL